MDRLKDQVVFVSGVTGGIGGATAKLLAARGAKLALSARDASKLDAVAAEVKQAGAEVFAAPADVTDEASVKQAIAAAKAHFGRLDTLVNVPGLSVPAKIAEMDLADYQRIMDVNVKGVFLCSKHFVQQADADRGGLIISISSVAGRAANPNAPVYCAAKAAMNMLSQGLQMQVKQQNIRVTILSPGAVSTPGFWGDRPVPHEKFLQPEDVAQFVGFIAGLPEHVYVEDAVFQPWNFYKTK